MVLVYFFFKKPRPSPAATTPQIQKPNTPAETQSQVEVPVAGENNAALSNPTPNTTKFSPAASFKTTVVNEDPLCLFGKKEFVAIPDFWLRSAYKSKDLVLSIPKDFAKCFTKDKELNVIFFIFNRGLMLPWKPLVSGSYRVRSVREFNSELESYAAGGQQSPLPEFFERYKSQPFTKIELEKKSLEIYPKFHPLPPTVHPFGTGLNDIAFQLRMNETNKILIDARSEKKKTKFPLAMEFSPAVFKAEKIHEHLVDIHEIQPKHFGKLKKLSPETNFLIVGSGERDFAPYNIATYLAMYGFKNTFYLTGPSKAFNFQPAKKISNSLNTISVEQAKADKLANQALFVDLRRGSSLQNGSIANAYRVTYLSSPTQDPEQDLKPNIAEFVKFVNSNRKKEKKIIFFGGSDADDRAIKTANLLKSSVNLTSYWLVDGFRAWGFYSKYIWNDIPRHQVAKEKRRGQRNSPAPDRMKVKHFANRPAQVSVPSSDFNQVSAAKKTRLTDKELRKERRREILSRRKNDTKDQSEKSRQ